MIQAKAIQAVGKAVGERSLGLGPGPVRAAVAAAITGSVTAAATYRLLRSGAGDETPSED